PRCGSTNQQLNPQIYRTPDHENVSLDLTGSARDPATFRGERFAAVECICNDRQGTHNAGDGCTRRDVRTAGLTTSTDELFAARLAFPVGDRVRGTVSTVPMGAGRAGVLVDLDQPPQGWVDALHLPDDWPAAGKAGLFEVLQHRPGQVRLFPLGARMRGRRTRYSRWSGEERAAIYPTATSACR
ncbi:hypothetical protein, partial [Micromonospora sp. NPDC023814]|uniref:hypothetical protein n=1 Tax=Micromonospora sp. NPDC023814 TaxID=3154596 RepID=UPI0033F684DF